MIKGYFSMISSFFTSLSIIHVLYDAWTVFYVLACVLAHIKNSYNSCIFWCLIKTTASLYLDLPSKTLYKHAQTHTSIYHKNEHTKNTYNSYTGYIPARCACVQSFSPLISLPSSAGCEPDNGPMSFWRLAWVKQFLTASPVSRWNLHRKHMHGKQDYMHIDKNVPAKQEDVPLRALRAIWETRQKMRTFPGSMHGAPKTNIQKQTSSRNLPKQLLLHFW